MSLTSCVLVIFDNSNNNNNNCVSCCFSCRCGFSVKSSFGATSSLCKPWRARRSIKTTKREPFKEKTDRWAPCLTS